MAGRVPLLRGFRQTECLSALSRLGKDMVHSASWTSACLGCSVQERSVGKVLGKLAGCLRSAKLDGIGMLGSSLGLATGRMRFGQTVNLA